MKEIEVKILGIDPKEIVARLNELGAEKIEAGIVNITAFDYPDDRLLKNGSYVRVRTFGHRSELVLKNPIERMKYKIMDEIETTVGDYDTTVKLFETLGLKTFAKQEKYRASYRLGNARIDIDKYPGMPWMLEVEAPSEEAVERGVSQLGYEMGCTTTESSRSIFSKHGLTSFFTFAEQGEEPDYDSLFE